ncbi:HEPN domain-containing protein [Catellatospora sichuanensis]|uniref:HEPN domain-containing protein n=1 Tax=Catellatospora sichuanensis TaxID=1969805 RepID=UPI001182A447|nr:HEPN domain-containing protein [Catellatospora sichuanensis]
MIDSRSGVWWTNIDPGKRVPGTLVRTSDAWQLDLVGTLAPAQEVHELQDVDQLALVPPTTIYGACLGTRYTLRHANLESTKEPGRHFDVPQDDRDQADDQHSQRWRGYELLEGDCLPNDALIVRAQFELTGLAAWWPYGGFRGENAERSRQPDYDGAEPSTIDCGNGLVLTIGSLVARTEGVRSRLVEERVVIDLEQPHGLTLDTLQQEIVMPLCVLLGIALHERVVHFNLRLQPQYGEHDPTWTLPIRVDPDVVDAVAESNPYRHGLMFTARDIDLATVIPRWFLLAQRNLVPFDVADQSRAENASLSSRVVEVVNAAETLHRTSHDQPADFPFASEVWEALKTTSLARSKREKVRSAVKLTETTLEGRLLQLVQALGREPCEWLLNGRHAAWAVAASTVRNALSHGYPTAHRVEQDHGAQIAIVYTTLAIIRLRLLIEAGIPNGTKLLKMIQQDRHYVALANQHVTDWAQLEARISGRESVANPGRKEVPTVGAVADMSVTQIPTPSSSDAVDGR